LRGRDLNPRPLGYEPMNKQEFQSLCDTYSHVKLRKRRIRKFEEVFIGPKTDQDFGRINKSCLEHWAQRLVTLARVYAAPLAHPKRLVE
jgi:hypothetical protein